MRVRTYLVWDAWIYGTSSVWPAAPFEEILGELDQMSFMAIVDGVDTSGNLGVRVHHSSDGVNYPNKNAADEILGPILTGTTNVLWGSDSGTLPSLHLIRIHIALMTGTTQAHVKFYVTLRDRSKGADDERDAWLGVSQRGD